ncbi:MAG: NAD-binding protein [Candidatus Kariarchaeaceae archaeon]|jgi:voltage-gated potassium channel
MRLRGKFRFELILAMVFGLNFIVSISLFSLITGNSFSQTMQIIRMMNPGGGVLSVAGISGFARFLLFNIAFTLSAIQLGLIILVLALISKRSYINQAQLEKLISDFVKSYPLRRIFTIMFLSIIFISLILIRTLEGLSWLDSLYFIIITISTVGFGDTIVTHPVTQIVTIVLILNGLTFIALTSQLLVNRIVDLQFMRQNPIPDAPLGIEDHIVIAGFGSKGRRLAQLFVERGYYVLIIERDEERANLARNNNYHVINGDITKPALLELISLQGSQGLFLLLSDDNMVIQTGILARSIAPNIDIYGEFLSLPTYEIARYAGINKPILLSIFFTNKIQEFLKNEDVTYLTNIHESPSQEATVSFVEIPFRMRGELDTDRSIVIGMVSKGYNEMYFVNPQGIEMGFVRGVTHQLVAIDREEKIQSKRQDHSHDLEEGRLIFAGYDPIIDSLVERLEFPRERIIILWQHEADQEIVMQKNLKSYPWSLENGHQLLEQIVRQGDLIICTFEDITSSLIVGVTLKNLKSSKMADNPPRLIQLVPYEYDIDPLMKVGADAVYTPQQIISSAMFSIFLKENHLSPSIVFTNGHLYEHFVTPDDSYDGRTIEEIQKVNFIVLYTRTPDTEWYITMEDDYVVSPDDRLLIFVKNTKKERLDPNY